MAKEKSKTLKRIGQAITIIGVIVIPLLYSYFYLGAFWDPYARLNDVPVAIVNMDEGAEINGKDRNIGEEVCNNLLEDGTLKFIETTDADAKDGVLNQKYYASITVPEDFSKCVATASQDTEKLHSKVIYSGNQKKNYLAAQIIENAMPKIQLKVNSSIDKEIISTLSEQISSVPDQMEELQDGLDKLHNGSVDLKDGTKQLNNGAGELKTGAKKLDDGTHKLNSNVPALKSGVSQLYDGSSKLNLGVKTLQGGLTQYTDGVSKANDGASTLKAGIEEYTAGVSQANDGASTLKAGITEYTNGVSAANTGADTLKAGISQYTAGVSTAKAGADQLKTSLETYTAGVDTLNSSYGQFSTGLNNAAAGVKNLKQSLSAMDYNSAMDLIESGDPAKVAQGRAMISAYFSGISGGVNQIDSAFGSASSNGTLLNADATIKAGLSSLAGNNTAINNGMSAISTGLSTLQANNATLNGGMSQLSNGLTTLESNNDKLNGGASQLSSGLSLLESNNATLNGGTAQLSTGLNTLTQNNKKLNDGAAQLNDGSLQLKTGLNSLNGKVPVLSSGIKQLANGSNQLYNGVAKLKDGTGKLNDGATQLQDGLKTAKDGVDDSVADTVKKLGALDGLAEYAEEPVKTETVNVQPVENYGSAFAPYFMCLSLWVGGLMIFFGIYLDYNKKIKSLTKDGKYFRNKIIAFSLIGLAQGGALAMVIKFALGITVNNFAFLVLSCAVVSMCFMSIIQFLIMALGNAGKFLALFLLILQLTSCAGTFPVETQSEFFQFINKILPMTYATQLFKEAISGTVGDWAIKNFVVIVIFWVAAIALGVVGRIINKKKTAKNENLIPA